MSFFSKLLSLLTPDTSALVPPIEAKRLLALPASEKPLLIDVRTPGEWKQGRIAGAKHIDVSGSEFDRKVQSLPKEASYLLYCRSGGRSGSALSRMKSMGFSDVKHISGGMGTWQAAGYPVTK
ncbi:MAG: rhodanese-like domain-containing protein [Fibrobacteres bacterium]|nr:rhodanese-like domain-containing protein [Fibrobacterota bacterium]